MMLSGMGVSWTSLLATAMAVTLACGCEATLETECISGDCTPYQPAPAEQNLGDCLESCALDQPLAGDGEFPCAVQDIMDNICTGCHNENHEASGAPFPLVTYEDATRVHAGQVIFAKMVAQVGLADDPVDNMPAGGPPLEPDQRSALLDDWACLCAPSRPAGETCN